MKVLRYVLIAIVAVIVIVIVAGLIVYQQWTRGPLPQHDGTLSVPGLEAPVDILRDSWGVPHIYASSTHDLVFAQGYTQAQDRWWQMEFFRHIGSGRIQELTGKNDSVMSQDVFIRTVGWYRAAEADFAATPEADLTILQAFADGVNAYITSRPAGALALEYNILGLTGVNIPIEPWSPVDTLVWGKVMSWNLSGNEDLERFLSSLIDKVSQDMAADYAPQWPFGEKPTILFPEDLPISDASLRAPSMTDTAGVPGGSMQLAGNFNGDFGLGIERDAGIGSNDWVVSGSKTLSGMPLLANDPHLSIQMPSIWYEVGLHCQPVSDACPYDVVGFTFSPTPLVIIGHNANIAWGVTNVGPDTQDLYKIEVNPDNPLQYKWDGEWRDMTEHQEVIRFGDSSDTVTVNVRETHLGPIINDNQVDDKGNLSGFNNDNPMALRWTALDPGGTLFMSVIELNKASNWQEFRDALRLWDTPSQNFVYADIQGNIGYQTPGKIPIRVAGDSGNLPVDGSTSANEWLGYVPFDDLPRIYNPPRGFVATANQALVPLDYYSQLADKLAGQFGADSNYVFSEYWDYGYRAQRIVEMLQANDQHTVATFEQIQGDDKVVSATEVLPYLQSLQIDDTELAGVRDWLMQWDDQMTMDSPQAALYAEFWQKLVTDVFDDQLGDLQHAGGSTENMWAIKLLLDKPDNPWWDDSTTSGTVETRDDILLRAFREAYDATVKALGSDRSTWRWGQLHTATFVSNPLGLSGIGPIEDMVNRGPVEVNGSTATINATNWSASSGDFSVQSLSSMRMIVDLSDFTNSVTIHTTGQSGHPFSSYYDNMIDSWRNIEYHPMLWTRDQVNADAKETLHLEPGS